jgi:uncharacterized protein
MQFNQQTKITVAGVSENPEKYGHKIFRDLLGAEYDVVGVNPKGNNILDQKIYPTLEDVPRETQLLIIVVPPKTGINVVKEAHELGIENIWLQPGAESQEIVEYALENDLNLTHSACFMTQQGIW